MKDNRIFFFFSLLSHLTSSSLFSSSDYSTPHYYVKDTPQGNNQTSKQLTHQHTHTNTLIKHQQCAKSFTFREASAAIRSAPSSGRLSPTRIVDVWWVCVGVWVVCLFGCFLVVCLLRSSGAIVSCFTLMSIGRAKWASSTASSRGHYFQIWSAWKSMPLAGGQENAPMITFITPTCLVVSAGALIKDVIEGDNLEIYARHAMKRSHGESTGFRLTPTGECTTETS